MKVGGVDLVCPRCHTLLLDEDAVMSCPACDSRFPVVDGIPDLRVAADPWIDMEDDRRKALRVLSEADGLDFMGHVETYWAMTPTTSPELARRFVEHVRRAESRSREWLQMELGSDHESSHEDPWLDLGCGTADFAVATPAETTVVGVDVAMRWLVVARRRLVEAGRDSHLVCANAEALPFPASAFSRVVSLGMMEHCADLDSVTREARRVLATGGTFRGRTVNRFSLLPEPHVGVWGVGFLPRTAADRYVRWRSGLGYEHHHPWSPGAIRRSLGRAGFGRVRVRAAATLSADLEGAGRWVRRLTPAYERLRRIPVVRSLANSFSPLLDLAAVAR